MTIEETLRATIHALDVLQIDTLRRLQNGHLPGEVALAKLNGLGEVWAEFKKTQKAADHSPELYMAYATTGGSANEPSRN